MASTLPPARRRRDAALAGHGGDEQAARAHLDDADGAVRATALAALARAGALRAGDIVRALADPDPTVRRRACTLAIPFDDVALEPLLADRDTTVVEAAAFALGERGERAAGAAGAAGLSAVDALAAVATEHDDPLCREAAVAALGAIGDERGLPAVLAATTDKPAVRRRAVIALAAFAGPDVAAALERARTDRDWQVRVAAEELLDIDIDIERDG